MKLIQMLSALLLIGVATTVRSEKGDDISGVIESHIQVHGAVMLQEFRDFLSLPNVSTNQDDMLANAEWITAYITSRGFDSTTVTAGGAPYVIASRHVSDTAPTVLIYAHFDGQPVQSANWSSPPFQPTLRDGEKTLDWSTALSGQLSEEWRLYARSAGDDKAPVIALMHAIDALEASGIEIRVNIKLFLDGEEEFGSPTLAGILEQHADKLEADLMLFCDGPMHQSRQRQLVFGVRGDTGVTLTTYGPNRPLHSGHYGNWAPHPTDTLIRLLATLKNEQGEITVPGYSDQVIPASSAEQAAVAEMPNMEAVLQDELALGRVEGGGRRLEELIMQPAIIIKGIQAGGVGTKSRNIILPSATASLDLRLVPGQTVAGVRTALESHFAIQGFHLVHDEPSDEIRRKHEKVLRVQWSGSGYRAFRTDMNIPQAGELVDILTRLDGQAPLMTPTMGGSLPIYLFEDLLAMPIIILPVANHDNNQHGRDENLRLGNLFDAVAIYAAVISEYGYH